MRYLAIDLGDKRTGLAVGDDVTELVTPLPIVQAPRGERLIEAVVRAIEAHDPDALVVGLALDMDGTEGPRAKIARDFGDDLAARRGLRVHYQDERLSSFAAEEHLAGSGRTRRGKKQIRDSLAAAEILRDFLRAGPAGGS